jgi:hypothetical protein
MANDLCALGETVTDRHLVLNLLQGLNKRFDHMNIFIKWSQLFPSFHTVRNDLELEEIELDHSATQGQASAFYFAPSGGGRPLHQQSPLRPPQQETPYPQAAPPPPTPNPNNDGKGKGKDKGKGKGKNSGSGGSDNNSDNNSKGASAGLLLQSLDRHHLDVARDASSAAAAGASTAAHPSRCIGVLRGYWRSRLRAPVSASTTPAAGHDPCLVALDGRMRSTVIDQLLQGHGLDSPDGHRLGQGLRRLQPHHLRCR